MGASFYRLRTAPLLVSPCGIDPGGRGSASNVFVFRAASTPSGSSRFRIELEGDRSPLNKSNEARRTIELDEGCFLPRRACDGHNAAPVKSAETSTASPRLCLAFAAEYTCWAVRIRLAAEVFFRDPNVGALLAAALRPVPDAVRTIQMKPLPVSCIHSSGRRSSASLSLSFYIYIYIYIYVYTYLSISLSICVCIYIYI